MSKLVRVDDNWSIPEEDLAKLRFLSVLREKTDPAKGPSSATDKTRCAIEAINLATSLIRQHAGWAFDHLAGCALEWNENPNQHKHEIVGRYISYRNFVLQPERYRPALASLLRSCANLFPEALGESLSEAVMALNMGEVHFIIAPLTTVHPAKSRTAWRRQMKAVCRLRHPDTKRRVHGRRKNSEDTLKKAARQ